MSRIIINCRGEKRRGKNIDDFRIKLGFGLHDLTMSEEESISTQIYQNCLKNKK